MRPGLRVLIAGAATSADTSSRAATSSERRNWEGKLLAPPGLGQLQPNSSVKDVSLSLLYYNARSLFPKLDHLKAECSLLNPDIICITESWLDDSITDTELRIPGFNLVWLDRNRHGGGVAIYIKSLFLYKIIFSGNLLECIIVSISSGSCKLCVCLFSIVVLTFLIVFIVPYVELIFFYFPILYSLVTLM